MNEQKRIFLCSPHMSGDEEAADLSSVTAAIYLALKYLDAGRGYEEIIRVVKCIKKVFAENKVSASA